MRLVMRLIMWTGKRVVLCGGGFGQEEMVVLYLGKYGHRFRGPCCNWNKQRWQRLRR